MNKQELFQGWIDGITGAWELAGKEAASRVYNEILVAYPMKRFEAMILGDKVREKLKEKGIL